MNIGILGTGSVGQTIGTRLVELGHHVCMGSRTAHNENAKIWAKAAGKTASHGTFDDAAHFGKLLFNCTSGMGSLEALQSIKPENLEHKLLIDAANPLDFSHGMPPSLTVCNTDSLGEQIQRAYPLVNVVKTLNTMNCQIMVHPDRVPGEHDVFMCGNNQAAKKTVTEILMDWFGWKSVIDLGDITASRGMEMVLPLWLSIYTQLDSEAFNFKIVK